MKKLGFAKLGLIASLLFSAGYLFWLASLILSPSIKSTAASETQTGKTTDAPLTLRYERAEVGKEVSFYELLRLAPETIKLEDERDQLLKADKPQKRYVFYKQMAKNGNYEKHMAVITFIDRTPPDLTFKNLTIPHGTPFDPLSELSVTDNVDGDLKEKVVVKGKVNTSSAGSYTLTYSVTDSSSNHIAKDRTIIVADEIIIAESPPPEEPAIPLDEPIPETPPAEISQAPIAEEEIPTISTPPAEPTQPPAPVYSANTLNFLGVPIPYQNGGTGSGQAIIDGNPYGTASTWGGAAVQSGVDGQNTHFIGHNPGIFASVLSLSTGSVITVTDSAGTSTDYVVQSILTVDDYGNDLASGANHWDLTVGTGGGERITLQTCITPDINLMVLAYA
ncbi:immunoglobulin-like domain-containing protein [Enterococcus sp. LJL51]|uniref:immunoglobulin-like domain-containing protein n=1 Tax=Enterococcus sp. LJL51 TaxID=3416656 RepID=UPI003CE67C9A